MKWDISKSWRGRCPQYLARPYAIWLHIYHCVHKTLTTCVDMSRDGEGKIYWMWQILDLIIKIQIHLLQYDLSLPWGWGSYTLLGFLYLAKPLLYGCLSVFPLRFLAWANSIKFYKIGEFLVPNSSAKAENWLNYQEIASFFTHFFKICWAYFQSAGPILWHKALEGTLLHTYHCVLKPLLLVLTYHEMVKWKTYWMWQIFVFIIKIQIHL